MLYPTVDHYKYWVDRLVAQNEVFAAYGDFPERGTFSSPFRIDRNPSCALRKAKSGKLYIVDYTTKESYDFIGLVMEFERKSFVKALEFLLDHFAFKLTPIKVSEAVKQRMEKVKHTSYAKIKIRVKKWGKFELSFWQKLGISKDTLKKYGVYPLKVLQINDDIYYSTDGKSTVYAYRMERGKYQIYMPYKHKGKFLCNCQEIMGWTQLPSRGSLVIITKSMKDVMVLTEMGYNAIAPIGEATILDEDTIWALDMRFDNILLLNDFDLTGIRSSIFYRLEYNIHSVFLTNGRSETKDYGHKDPADYVKAHGMKKGKKAIEEILNNPLW